MMLLYFIGLGNLYSASTARIDDAVILSSHYQKQILWGAGGLIVMIIAMGFDYHRIKSISHFFYVGTILSLILVLIAGKLAMGARRWIDLGFFQFQPSEFAKIAVIIMVAEILSKDGTQLDWKELGKVCAITILPATLIILQPDLGTAMMLFFIMSGMALYHGVKKQILKTVFFSIPPILVSAWFFLLHDYQKRRITTFLDPSSDPLDAGYHIMQAKIAIGSGQLLGKGWMQGTQSQLRFLPEKHTDFAIAVFGEEWGYVGCIAIITLFSLFMLSMVNTVKDAKDRFGSTLVAGIMIYFFCQIFINIGMVLGILPIVGIPLPFISYGGSATLQNFALVGLVMNISMHRFMFRAK